MPRKKDNPGPQKPDKQFTPDKSRVSSGVNPVKAGKKQGKTREKPGKNDGNGKAPAKPKAGGKVKPQKDGKIQQSENLSGIVGGKPGESYQKAKLLFFGSRSLTDARIRALILQEIAIFNPSTIVTAGEPIGVCQLAREAAKERSIQLKLHFVDPMKNAGKYHHRSVSALKDCDLAIFIHDGESNGTQNEIKVAQKLKTPYKYHLVKPLPPPQMPAGTISRTGQQPPADQAPPAAGSGGVDPTKPIGQGNPPAASQFKPGQSGNPKGYPKGRPNTKTIIKFWLSQEEEIENPITKELVKVQVVDTMVLGLIARARKGDVGAFRELMDRIDGKPVQSNKITLENNEGGQILVGFMAPGATITKPAPPADEQG